MRQQLFITLLLLSGGICCALPSHAQDDAFLYKQLNQSLSKGNYAQALKLIDQGADILHGGRYINSTYKVKAKKMPGFLVLLTLPLSLFNRSYTKTDHYDKLTIALHEVLKDTTRSPAKLQIVEYLLKKGAPPNGGRLLYGPEVRPVATAIESWDLEAFWLLKKYGAKLTGKYFNALSKVAAACDCSDTSSQRFKEMKQTMDTLINTHGFSPYDFHWSLGRDDLAPLFFKYVPPEKLDTVNYENPIKLACKACNLARIKKYKAMGFTWEGEKKEALKLVFKDDLDCYELMEYYVRELNLNINQDFLCRAIKFYSLKLIKHLLFLDAKFNLDCTPKAFERLIRSRFKYKQSSYCTWYNLIVKL
ncbi:hypothetical protein [uncultured Microscilla sp.]|uniref:hypothetical protein n=1 Tax=uncultured Microscilla sp. TaxID=432653 RepID=UPI0026078F11|nr:hypothetical protein [uncultured Microscilla sp.]